MQPNAKTGSCGPHMVGRYEVIHPIAQGATGVVYLARLAGPGGFERLFAVKTLRRDLPEQERLTRLLLAEGQLSAHIRHPNAVSMIEVGTDEEAGHFLVMDYVDGVSLAELLSHPELDSDTRVRIGLTVVLDALAGLAAAHHARQPGTDEPLTIVHGDVSTDNVLIGLDGIGRVADFGLAHAVGHCEPGVLTGVSGTPAYMSPEQASGHAGPDTRSDVYSMGVVLWEVLTGEWLIDRDMPAEQQLACVIHAEAAPPSEYVPAVSTDLDQVCLRALAKSPDDRFQDAEQLRAALRAAAADLGASTDRVTAALRRFFAHEIAQRRTWFQEPSAVRPRPAGPGEASAAERCDETRGQTGIDDGIDVRRDDGGDRGRVVSDGTRPEGIRISRTPTILGMSAPMNVPSTAPMTASRPAESSSGTRHPSDKPPLMLPAGGPTDAPAETDGRPATHAQHPARPWRAPAPARTLRAIVVDSQVVSDDPRGLDLEVDLDTDTDTQIPAARAKRRLFVWPFLAVTGALTLLALLLPGLSGVRRDLAHALGLEARRGVVGEPPASASAATPISSRPEASERASAQLKTNAGTPEPGHSPGTPRDNGTGASATDPTLLSPARSREEQGAPPSQANNHTADSAPTIARPRPRRAAKRPRRRRPTARTRTARPRGHEPPQAAPAEAPSTSDAIPIERNPYLIVQ